MSMRKTPFDKKPKPKKDDFDEFEKMYQQINKQAETNMGMGGPPRSSSKPKQPEGSMPTKPKFNAASFGIKPFDLDDSNDPTMSKNIGGNIKKEDGEISKQVSKPFSKQGPRPVKPTQNEQFAPTTLTGPSEVDMDSQYQPSAPVKKVNKATNEDPFDRYDKQFSKQQEKIVQKSNAFSKPAMRTTKFKDLNPEQIQPQPQNDYYDESTSVASGSTATGNFEKTPQRPNSGNKSLGTGNRSSKVFEKPFSQGDYRKAQGEVKEQMLKITKEQEDQAAREKLARENAKKAQQRREQEEMIRRQQEEANKAKQQLSNKKQQPELTKKKSTDDEYGDSDFEKDEEDEYGSDFEEDDQKMGTGKFDNKIIIDDLQKSNAASKPFSKPFGNKQSTSTTANNNQFSTTKVNQPAVSRSDFESEIFEDPNSTTKGQGQGGFQTSQQEKNIEIHQVDDELIQLQKARVARLKEYLNFEHETFDNLLEINPVSEYELYINKIQGGSIKNSNDQTNDENATKETQTEEEFERNIAIQWPEDKNKTFAAVNELNIRLENQQNERPIENEIAQDTTRLIDFVKNAFPYVDEVLAFNSQNFGNPKEQMKNFPMMQEAINFPKPLASIFQNPIISCSYHASKSSLFAAYLVDFTSQSTKYQISIVIQYEEKQPRKFFLSLSQITSLYLSQNFKHGLIAGTKDGSVILWDLRDSSHQHKQASHDLLSLIRQKQEAAGISIDDFIFRLPNYTSDHLAEQGHNSAVIKIKDVYSNNTIPEIYTLEEFGRASVWSITELSKYEQASGVIDAGMNINSTVKLLKTADFSLEDFYFNYDKDEIVCTDFDVDKSGSNVFIANTKGVAKADKLGQQKTPKTFEDNEIESEISGLPTCVAVSSGEYFYVGYSDGSIRVFSKNFGQPVYTIRGFSQYKIVNIMIPKYYPITLRNPAKYVEQLAKPIVFDQEGNIFFFEIGRSAQPISVQNLAREKLKNHKFRLLDCWFDSNLDLHTTYSVGTYSMFHANISCVDVLDSNHEPIMKRNNQISSIFKIIL